MRTLFRGQIEAGLIIPVLVGLLYAGTGNWSAERWNGALAIMGLGGALKAGRVVGFSEGYNTYNPELHQPVEHSETPPGRPRDDHGRFVRRED